MPLLKAILPAPGSASEVEFAKVIASCELVPLAPVAPVAPVGKPKVKLNVAALDEPALATAAVAEPPAETVLPVTVPTSIVAASPVSPFLTKVTDNSSAALKKYY